MKKQLVASLAAAMILGVAGTSFAASNPFVDVPAKHWSYDSVTKLAQAGVIDGYGDGTFKGDKTVTRYEMAQMVAKAMGNQDKATAAQKAEIKKLQAEYSDELDKLGVRVGNLEKNQPNLKFNGTMALRYTSIDDEAGTNAASTAVRYRLRLEAKATVDENTTFGMRVANNSINRSTSLTTGLPTGTTWTTFGSETGSSDNAVLDRVFFTTKMNSVTATAGRQALVVGTTQAIVDNGMTSFDGLKLATTFGTVNATVNHGRLLGQKDLDVVELSTKTGKLNYGVGYFRLQDNANVKNVAFGKDMLKLTYLNASYKFNPTFSLTAEGGQNKADYATSDNKFYTVLAKYGAQSLAKKGDQNFIAQFSSVGANALALDAAGKGLTTLDTAPTTDKFTAWDFSYNRAISKNFSGEVHYVKVDDKATTAVSNDYNYFRVNLIAKF